MKLDAIYVVHHSHTDIGYTADQPIFWELEARFILDALDLVDRCRDWPSDSAFRWTVETTAPLEAFLRTASVRDVERFVRAEREGFVEVTAMLANLTPLADAGQLVESLGAARRLRAEYGFDIRHAMNCDVNGHNWILADLLLDEGIEAFSMSVNQHFGGPPEPRPEVFLWEAPSGRLLPSLNGWQYTRASDFGIGDETDERLGLWLPRIEAKLEENGARLPFFLLQGIHPFGDNGGAWDGYARFARRWNEAGNSPRIVSATPRMFWSRIAEFRDELPTRRGDWTDYWNFGSVSTARETAASRASRERLRRADSLMAAVEAADPAPAGGADPSLGLARRSYRLYRDEAWRELNLFAEHSWGADESANFPDAEDCVAIEAHKKSFAWRARSLSIMLERDALADLARLVERSDSTDLLVFNSLPWPRTVCGPVGRGLAMVRGLPEDGSASRHFLGRNEPPTDFWTGREGIAFHGNMGLVLPPTEVPAFGWTVVPASSLEFMAQAEPAADFELEGGRFRLAFDPARGDLVSLVDRATGRELVDPSAGLPFHGFVHEEVADRDRPDPRKAIYEIDWTTDASDRRGWKPDWEARRSSELSLRSHAVYRLPFETIVEQVLEHPKVGPIRRRIVLPEYADHAEFQAEWSMGGECHPEATYLAFPFALPGAQARFDAGGAPVRPEADQLPGVNRDYFTVQEWVDFNDGARGVTVAAPDNPMVQLGGFGFGKGRRRFELERPLLLGWITNNYWETNFPVRQPGAVAARYAIRPYEGPFDQAEAHRFAASFANARPLLQPLGEAPAGPGLPSTGSLLRLPAGPFRILSLRPEGGRIAVDLLNAGSSRAAARLESGLARIAGAQLIDAATGRGTPLAVERGSVALEVDPFMRARLSLEAYIPVKGERA